MLPGQVPDPEENIDTKSMTSLRSRKSVTWGGTTEVKPEEEKVGPVRRKTKSKRMMALDDVCDSMTEEEVNAPASGYVTLTMTYTVTLICVQ